MYNLKIILLFSFIIISYSIQLNKKPFENKFCNSCDKCSLGYTGGGVLLYKNKGKNKKFIFGIDYKNELTDLGGQINSIHEKVWETASRELFEESNGIFNIDKKEIGDYDYIDIDRINHKYRCYFIPIKNFDKKKFYSNKANSIYSTNSFKEIIDIVIIQEENLKKMISNESNYLNKSPDIIPYIISPRLKKILSIYYEI